MTANKNNWHEVLPSPGSAEDRKRMVTSGTAEFDDSYLLTGHFDPQADRR
jgi:hypothetical protein